MKKFQLNTVLNGEPVLLSVESMEPPVQSRYSFFSISRNEKRVAVLKMDGECKLEFTSDETFEERDIEKLCREISKFVGNNNGIRPAQAIIDHENE